MQITAPDIGVDKALVAEILVKVGDRIEVDQSIVVLESDKATVEVPSTSAGVVKAIMVENGAEVAEGTALIELEAVEGQQTKTTEASAPEVEITAAAVEVPAPAAEQTVAPSTTNEVIEVKVPDIGVEKALIAEVLVKVGDQIEVDQSVVVAESDKATVEVPSPVAGTVESISVKNGDVVKEGVLLLTVKAARTVPAPEQTATPAPTTNSTVTTVAPVPQPTTAPVSAETVITVPDLGVDKAAVAEILVKVGDRVDAEQSIVVVESDKATVEVPSTAAGVVKAIHVTEGQQVSQGIQLITIEGQTTAPAAATTATPVVETVKPSVPAAVATAPVATHSAEKLTPVQQAENAKVYAGPAVRQLARELGVLLAQVQATGPHGRVLKEDVFAYVKQRLTAPVAAPVQQIAAAPSGLPALPDFSAFGGGEVKGMTRLQQVSVPQLSLNNYIPQVTQFDLADITELEAWRNDLKGNFKKEGISLTILAFIAKAVAHLLKDEAYFASHLADDQKSVLLRNEIHMGIAVATPDGLTVPVLRNPDQKSIKQIAVELAELSQKARDKKLSPKDLQGANFTITSLGSIGGTAFTPLVNWPQVAILGISPATMQPVWNGSSFDPRLMLPLSLSYDHRVINGADAARFTNKLTKLLKDIRSLLL
ncbi:2-oxo acid dehydrogenase subunit E2 [Acinetobacter sp. CAAS 2-6]|uniref:2-oxo acid dehydrogenase subunit E2 n=1 Tax=Acinetobacter sp. CAAS 2-6 TaxID=3016358 RepID=UPI002DD6546A|nr:2-oxo acid dehydrogenase subunit E2 [Acinetobacter sp. CAAS 2-6]